MKKILSIFTALAITLANAAAFAEDFENISDTSAFRGMTVNDTLSHSGKSSLEMTQDVASASFSAPRDAKTAVCWFFDNTSNKTVNTNALVKAGGCIIGVYGNVSCENYLVKNTEDDVWYITDIARSGGWHQFVFDTSTGGTRLYIDGKLVKNFKKSSDITELRIYDHLENGNVSGMCIDDVEFFTSIKEVELSGSGAASSVTDYDFDNLMCGSVVLKVGENIAYVKNYKTDIDVSPMIINNRTYVPVRFLSEGFGGVVTWDPNKKCANIIYEDKEIKMTLGEDTFWINGEKAAFDAAPVIRDSRTLVPIRAFCTAAGLNVYWDERGFAVITKPDSTLTSANKSILNQIAALFDGVKKSEVMARVYVSPDGDDENDGSENMPLKTINKAKEKVRQIISRGMTGDIEVVLSGGTYAENVTFTEADSGLGHYKVIYKNKDGEKPVVYGGSVVSGWEKYTDDIYKTHIGKEEFHVLTENGELSTKARFPNDDYALVTENAANVTTSFYFDKGLNAPNVKDKNNLEVYMWGGGGIAWAANIKKCEKYDPKTGYVEMDSAGSYNMTVNSRFYLQGALEFIDKPGEFYYDKKNGDLYYYPKNLPIEDQEIAIPAKHNFIEFLGESEDKPIRNIKITGIELNTCDRDCYGIYMHSARNIEIDSVRLLNIGGIGIKMSGYNYANRIVNCEIGNIGYDGITMSNLDTSDLTTTMYGKFNEVKNCEIYSVGRVIGDGSGVGIATGYNTVQNCLIRDGHRMGISVGSPRPGTIIGKVVDGITLDRSNVRLATHSQNNAFMFCDIYDVMNDSQDGGAIYSWGGDEGNIVAYNHIHDTMTPFSEGFGIYLDDAADVFTVKNNIVDNMWREGFGGKTMASIFAKGIKHTIDNNFVVESPKNMYACMTESMVGEPCYEQSWYRNIVSNSGPYTYFNKAFTNSRFKAADYNFYYNPTGEYKIAMNGFSGKAASDVYAWQRWFANGKYDQFAEINQDPLFYDAAARDYRLTYNSDTYKLGITDIDEGRIGLTKDYPYAKDEELKKLYLDTSDSRIYGSTINLGTDEEIALKPYARTKIAGYVVDAEGAEYKTDNAAVAVVDDKGTLKAVSKGITKLTVSFGGLELSCDVIVGDSWSEGVIYSEPTESIEKGKTIPSNVYVKTEMGQTVKNFLSIKYESTDESIATVDEAGNVTGVSAGKCDIKAKITDGKNSISASMTVNVLDKAVSGLKIKDDEYLTIVREKSETMSPIFEAVYSDGTTADIKTENAKFESSDESVFSVDETGTITGHKLGRATLNVTYSEDGITKYADFEVRVREVGLRADTFIWASSCDDKYGVVINDSMEGAAGDNDANEWLLYKDVDFGNGGFTEFWTSYCLTNQYGGKIVQWRLDSLDGPIIGEIKVTASGSWSEYLDQKITMSNTDLMRGVHDVYVCNTQDGTGSQKGWYLK